jgi:hypothetical protein
MTNTRVRDWLVDEIIWDNHACMPLQLALSKGVPTTTRPGTVPRRERSKRISSPSANSR